MRIAFLGKGGSGKTTLSVCFSLWAARQLKREVLMFDADINAHAQNALGIEKEMPTIGHAGEEIANYLRGNRTDLGDKPLLSTTPPAHGSRFISCSANDPLISRYAAIKDGVVLINVGRFRPSDVGANCYHTKLHSLCMIMNHLIDSKEDLVVVDATAGTDTLSTSLLIAYDLNLFVVEPTMKSISVYLDYINTDSSSDYKTFVIINKVIDSEDYKFVLQNIPEHKILAQIPFSKSIRQLEQNTQSFSNSSFSDFDSFFDNVYRQLQQTPKDWDLYLKRLREIHDKNCLWWYNDYYQQELNKGLDNNFSYIKAVELT